MKNQNAKENTKRKITSKRKFLSAPNLPTDQQRLKAANELFMVPPQLVRKQRAEKAAEKALEKPKKPKPSGKVSNKKINEDNIDKVIRESFRSNFADNKVYDDYQFQIKKNIIRLLSAARKQIEDNPESIKKTGKNKKAKDTGKEIKTIKQPNDQNQKQQRANTANLPRRNAVMQQTRPQSAAASTQSPRFFDSEAKKNQQINKKKTIQSAKKNKPKSEVKNTNQDGQFGGVSLFDEIKAVEEKAKMNKNVKKQTIKNNTIDKKKAELATPTLKKRKTQTPLATKKVVEKKKSRASPKLQATVTA